MKKRILPVLIFCILILTACMQNASGVSTPTSSTYQGLPATGNTPQPTHIQIDLTPAQKAAMQALADKHNIAIDQIILVSTEAVTWPNGCLGVEPPGTMCTQALVDGFRIILSANGQTFEYHTNQDGTQVIEATSPLVPNP